MRKLLPASNRWSRVITRVSAVMLFIATLSPVAAEEQSLKDGAKHTGRAVGAAAHDIGQGAKKVGKDVVQGTKEAGKAIGDAAKEGGKEFRRAVKGE